MAEQECLHVIAVVIFDLKIARFENLGFFAGSANCVRNIVETTDLSGDISKNTVPTIYLGHSERSLLGTCPGHQGRPSLCGR